MSSPNPPGTGASDELFRILVENVQEYAIFMLDSTGHIVTWNRGAERLKQWRADEIIGRHFSTFYTAEDLDDDKPARELVIAEREGKYEEEGPRVRKDGSTFIANVLITALFDENQKIRGFAKVTRDITERKAAELQLRRAVEELEQASRVKDEFLTTVSHELRTPMTAILGWAALLTSGTEDEHSVREGVRSIFESAQLQARLIDDLIDVAQSITGSFRLELKTIDLAEVLMRTTEAARPAAASKGIQIQLILPPSPAVIKGDRGRLQQVVWNLFSNALKFTAAGGTIRLELTTDAQAASLRFSDTGRGMDQETLRHIFRRFWQGESSTTRASGGLGIGLALTRHIVELHGGEITAESGGPGEGATFTVTVPLALDAISPDRASTESGALRGTIVLLVEDDPAARLVLARMVEEYGAEVIPVASVDEALRSLESRIPDVVLSDIAMPGLDGYAFIRSLRQHARGSSVPAIAITAVYLRPEDRASLLAAGFDGYIRKPVLPADLNAVMLQTKRASQE